MKIVIRDRNHGLIDELKKLTWDENVTIEVGDIFLTPADAFVSPANSFGHMDGGIDLYYSQTIGWHLETLLRKRIKEETPFNELLVGQAMTIKTDHKDFPLMISAPTMRMPGPIPSTNVFLATRVSLHLARLWNIETVLLPGMGTGVGRVPYDQAAFAMNSGYISAKKFFEESTPGEKFTI